MRSGTGTGGRPGRFTSALGKMRMWHKLLAVTGILLFLVVVLPLSSSDKYTYTLILGRVTILIVFIAFVTWIRNPTQKQDGSADDADAKRVLRYAGLAGNEHALMEKVRSDPQAFKAIKEEYSRRWLLDAKREMLVRFWCEDARLCWRCGDVIIESTGIGCCQKCSFKTSKRWDHNIDAEVAYRLWCEEVKCCHACFDLLHPNVALKKTEGLCRNCYLARMKARSRIRTAKRIFSDGRIYDEMAQYIWNKFLKRRSGRRHQLPLAYRTTRADRINWIRWFSDL